MNFIKNKNMIKKSLIIGMMSVSFLGMSQVQCTGITKKNIKCIQITKDASELCHNHNPNYVKKEVLETVVCGENTKKNTPCKSRTKDVSGKCHNHRD